jgi:type II secretory pathway component PulM
MANFLNSKEKMMVIAEFIILLVTVAGLFIWNRAEARADIRHMDTKLDSIRELTNAIHLEMRDFHNRLYELEKKRSGQ